MPIRDFLMDASGDLAVVNGDFAVAGGDTDLVNTAAVMQAIKIRVRFFLSEYYLDESIGVDWLGQILIKNPDPLVVRELLRAAIAGVPDVVEVLSTELVNDGDRRAHIDFTVRTKYSAAISGSITSP